MTSSSSELDPIATLRLLINDPTGDPYDGGTTPVFTDPEITNFLTLESGNIKRAAAQALDVIASNEALVAKVITDRQITTNGDRVAKAIRDHANQLRAQADADDAKDGVEDYFDIIPNCSYPNGYSGGYGDGCYGIL